MLNKLCLVLILLVVLMGRCMVPFIDKAPDMEEYGAQLEVFECNGNETFGIRYECEFSFGNDMFSVVSIYITNTDYYQKLENKKESNILLFDFYITNKLEDKGFSYRVGNSKLKFQNSKDYLYGEPNPELGSNIIQFLIPGTDIIEYRGVEFLEIDLFVKQNGEEEKVNIIFSLPFVP